MGTRAQERRQREWARFRADMADQWRTEAALLKAESKDRKNAVKAGEIDEWTGASEGVHLLITLLTAGAWAPVWIYVSLRNQRRKGKTSVGRNDKARRRIAQAELKARRKERARAPHPVPSSPAARPIPGTYTPAPVPVMPSVQAGPWARVSQRDAQPLPMRR